MSEQVLVSLVESGELECEVLDISHIELLSIPRSELMLISDQARDLVHLQTPKLSMIVRVVSYCV